MKQVVPTVRQGGVSVALAMVPAESPSPHNTAPPCPFVIMPYLPRYNTDISQI